MDVLIDGQSIEYTEQGNKDGIPVLLLHGWGASFDLYKGIMGCLADRCRLVAVNFPGCGKSETMKEPWELDDYCDFVIKFCDALNLQNPILIGHSHGGRVSLKLAATGMIRPPKMVLFDSAGLIPVKTPKQKRRARNFKIIKKILSIPIINKFSAGLLEKARKHYGSADYNAAPPVLRKTMVSLVNTDLRDILGNISCPTLLIWGDNDTATPLSDGRIMEKLIPDSGLCVIKGTGHFSFCEKPYEVYPILLSFIK